MLYRETPNLVVLDESIELAKKFGTENSPQFVNGLLDKLIPASAEDESHSESE